MVEGVPIAVAPLSSLTMLSLYQRAAHIGLQISALAAHNAMPRKVSDTGKIGYYLFSFRFFLSFSQPIQHLNEFVFGIMFYPKTFSWGISYLSFVRHSKPIFSKEYSYRCILLRQFKQIASK